MPSRIGFVKNIYFCDYDPGKNEITGVFPYPYRC
jgi:hypothetical protein